MCYGDYCRFRAALAKLRLSAEDKAARRENVFFSAELMSLENRHRTSSLSKPSQLTTPGLENDTTTDSSLYRAQVRRPVVKAKLKVVPSALDPLINVRDENGKSKLAVAAESGKWS